MKRVVSLAWETRKTGRAVVLKEAHAELERPPDAPFRRQGKHSSEDQGTDTARDSVFIVFSMEVKVEVMASVSDTAKLKCVRSENTGCKYGRGSERKRSHG